MGAKATHDLAPRIRAAFVRAIARKGGDEELAKMVGKSLDDDFVATLNAISKYTVKEQRVSGKVEHDHKHEFARVQEETKQFVDAVAGRSINTDDPVSLPH